MTAKLQTYRHEFETLSMKSHMKRIKRKLFRRRRRCTKVILDAVMRKVVTVDEAEEEVDVGVDLMKTNKIRSLNVTIVTNSIIKKLIVGKNREMRRTKQTNKQVLWRNQ